ncbi:MAG: ribosome recycling factor [Planctomycetota bacterium]|nr:ribosome recycling factor [Planctomycetota bacterium]
MPLDEILFEAEEKMETAVRILTEEFKTIRTGRASPALVDSLRVDAYGTTTPLKQLATIGAPDPRQLVIRPFDPNIAGDIEKAILKSDLGLTPNNDGKLIRIPIPPLSEERRRQIINRLKEMTEETRVSVRNIRRDANRQIDLEQKDGTIPEDNAFKGKDEVQELTGKYEKDADDALEVKTAEVMEV